MRVNLSVAIVYMASDFDWDEKTNGVILGMFFYGYVLTQVLYMMIPLFFGFKNHLRCLVAEWQRSLEANGCLVSVR